MMDTEKIYTIVKSNNISDFKNKVFPVIKDKPELISFCMNIACEHDYLEIVTFLANETNNVQENKWAFMTACGFNSILSAFYLYNKGADLSYMNNYALRWAARNGHYYMVQILLNLGMDVQCLADFILPEMAHRRNLKMFKVLLPAGFKKSLVHALQIAVETNQELLVKYILDSDLVNKELLKIAIFPANTPMRDLLVDHGANPKLFFIKYVY